MNDTIHTASCVYSINVTDHTAGWPCAESACV